MCPMGKFQNDFICSVISRHVLLNGNHPLRFYRHLSIHCLTSPSLCNRSGDSKWSRLLGRFFMCGWTCGGIFGPISRNYSLTCSSETKLAFILSVFNLSCCFLSSITFIKRYRRLIPWEIIFYFAKIFKNKGRKYMY